MNKTWIKIWIKFPSLRFLIKDMIGNCGNIYVITFWKLWKQTHLLIPKRKSSSLALLTKVQNKVLKWSMWLISTWKVESCAGQKAMRCWKKRRLSTKNRWNMSSTCSWSWIFQHFVLPVTILTYFLTDFFSLNTHNSLVV